MNPLAIRTAPLAWALAACIALGWLSVATHHGEGIAAAVPVVFARTMRRARRRPSADAASAEVSPSVACLPADATSALHSQPDVAAAPR